MHETSRGGYRGRSNRHCRLVSLLALPVLLVLPVVPAAGGGREVVVRVDPRVELMSVIFRLAGNPEYGNGRVKAYSEAVEAHFDKFRDHAVVKLARELRRKHGVSYDAVMNMAVHIKDVKGLKEAVSFDREPRTLERRWSVKDARRFLAAARKFVKEAKFAAFLKKHAGLYRTAEKRLAKTLAEHADLDWFDKFFGARSGAEFEIAIGMLNGPGNYGARIRKPGGKETLYCVLGVWRVDSSGDPTFPAAVLGTVVHEFCHSYANPLVNANAAKLQRAGEALWPHVADTMRRQAYGNWKTMMYESLVRACVVRYMHATGGAKAAARQQREEGNRGFRWVGGMAAQLALYEADRKAYPNLEAFFPRIAAYLEGYADGFAGQQRDAAAPRVVEMSPANGADDVDPATTEIRVTFSRPMRDGAWAFVGGGPHYPETTGRPSYDAARKVITLPVKLKPAWRYEFWLNRGKYNSFCSEDNVPLEPVRVAFRTGPGK